MLKLGSHVGMSGKKMMLGSVEEALSYGANTFMIYTGAPQNTRRKEISDQIVITVGYDIENLTDPERRKKYRGEVVTDRYGRQIPKHAHGTENLESFTSSTQKMVEAASVLYDRIVDKNLLIRRMNITANNIVEEKTAPQKNRGYQQLDLFTDYAAEE